jgi:hypothetical protein
MITHHFPQKRLIQGSFFRVLSERRAGRICRQRIIPPDGCAVYKTHCIILAVTELRLSG